MTTQVEAHPQLHSMIEDASRGVEQLFDVDGEIGGMWLFVTSNGREVVMPAPNINDKDFAMALVRMMFEAENVVRCLHITEAWTVEAHGEAEIKAMEAWLARGASAQDHPRRREVVTFIAEDNTGQLTAQREIVRPANGKPRLGPLRLAEFTESYGRAVGMLPRRRGEALQ